jgi:hypothetical protein
MLKTAIQARLPIIEVATTDPLNVAKVLEHYAGQPVEKLRLALRPPKLGPVPAHLDEDGVYYTVSPTDAFDAHEVYEAAVEKRATVIVVNSLEPITCAFQCGEVPMPEPLLQSFVEDYAPEGVDKYALAGALRGLTFKEMVEVSRLAMAESGEFTPASVSSVRRRRMVLSSGLRLVDTRQTYYTPPAFMDEWLQVSGELFTRNVDIRVRPRGLLFHGDPGTGKTAGAKYIAERLRLPLYLFDVGGMMQKYVGESEKNFQTALAQIESLAPCVMLMDEVEKVFDTHDESGVSRRILGSLLWWLQEHKAQVLTVMTTNKEAALPQELVRPGRIDAWHKFEPLADEIEAVGFANELAEALADIYPLSEDAVDQLVKLEYFAAKQTGVPLSQARLTQSVVGEIKARLAEKLRRDRDE